MNGHKILSSAAIAAERQRVTRRREIRRGDPHGWLSVAFPFAHCPAQNVVRPIRSVYPLNPITIDGVPIVQTGGNDDAMFSDALQGLHRGDFSRLERLFDERSGRSGRPRIVEWHDEERFRDAEGAGGSADMRVFSRSHERRRLPVEACTVAQRLEQRSGRPSTNRDAIIRRSSKTC